MAATEGNSRTDQPRRFEEDGPGRSSEEQGELLWGLLTAALPGKGS
jgi:hypothetical protein